MKINNKRYSVEKGIPYPDYDASILTVMQILEAMRPHVESVAFEREDETFILHCIFTVEKNEITKPEYLIDMNQLRVWRIR